MSVSGLSIMKKFNNVTIVELKIEMFVCNKYEQIILVVIIK